MKPSDAFDALYRSSVSRRDLQCAAMPLRGFISAARGVASAQGDSLAGQVRLLVVETKGLCGNGQQVVR
ncbi:hypothetical protein [Synechococcus sp. BIOS-E4-1]|uniref:hypothetical protein n=1 Tax=Synechococcus sp. BIOS-E4-1 TaxID=1400864 RepID=UPI001647EC03|nr:hypothetical protein [Synechococcus sp. BIOS-E4-1]